MISENLAEELQNRGFVHQFSGDDLNQTLADGKRTIYLGVDPTADSMHVGNLAVLMLLRYLAEAGHNVIFLVGGGTGLIGDPKPDVERPLSDPETVERRVKRLKQQAESILGTKVRFVNNHDWLASANLIDFLRDVGKHFTVNELIKKEAIARRLEGEQGISYTEFAYPLLQAFDYLTLNREYGCDVQVGASDQWGNIVAGVDLIRRLEQKTVYALTSPLITDKSTGKKFGKSEGNAVWLDAELTSPYHFYQFWLNTSDESVGDFLKIFTLLPLAEIAEIVEQAGEAPGERLAQKRLAYEVTVLVHGEKAANASEKISNILFGGEQLASLSEEEAVVLKDSAPTHQVKEGDSLIEVLVSSQLASSKREAREFIENGAVELSGDRITSVDQSLEAGHFVSGLATLRRGKKHYQVLVLE